MNDTQPPAVTPAEALEIDRTCDRFEAAWKAGRRPRPEEYLGATAQTALLRQLLLLDWDYRRRAGEDPSAGDYLARFPGDPALVAEVGRTMAEPFDSTREGPDARETPWSGDRGGAGDDVEREADLARYELVAEVGRGGIGVVFRGRDRRLRRELAVKVLREGYRDRPDARRRFLAEARVGGRLQHPAIVPVYEMGWFDDHRPYITMKLVEGQTFAELLRHADRGRDLPRLLSVFEQVCQAAAYAHSRGVVHRDLKPANVMVGAFGEVQVMDWGFAKVLAGEDGPAEVAPTAFGCATASHSGTLMGTPAYMPPEQAQGDVALIDPRADVFALGAILCEILTGRPPYTGETADDVCRRAAAGDLADAVRRLDTCGADYALRDLARRCLAPARSARPDDAGAVAADLAEYLASARERLRQAQLDRAAAESRAQSERRARRLTGALAAALGLLLAAGGAFAWHSDRQTAQRRAEEEGRERDERTRLSLNAVAVAALLDQCETALRADRADQAAVALGAAERRAADGGAGELAGRLARCRADVGLLRALDDIDTWRWTLAGRAFPDGKSEAARWRAALAEYGVTPDEGQAAELAAKVNGSLIRDRVLTALDLWLAFGPADGVRAVLQSADPDSYRDAVRDAVDTQGLIALAGRPEALAQPARFAAVLGQLVEIPAARRRAVLVSALRARTGDLGLLMALGQTYPINRPEGAGERTRWFQAALAAHPGNLAALNSLGIALGEKGDLDGAVEAYREAVRLDSKYAKAHNNLGVALRDKGDAGGAVAAFKEAVRLDPKSADAYSNLGRALRDKGDPGGAVAAFKEAIRLEPRDVNVHISLGAILCDVKRDYEGAAVAFQEAIRLEPKEAKAHYGLGNAQLGKGNTDDAVEAYREAVRLDPKYAKAHINLGVALRDKGDAGGAVAAFQEAIRVEPKYVSAHTRLAWLLATGPAGVRNGKRAVEHATRACELTAWTVPDSIATLAAAHAEAGDFDRAVEFQRKALSFPAYEKGVGKAGRERLELFARKIPYRDPALLPREVAPPPREAKP